MPKNRKPKSKKPEPHRWTYAEMQAIGFEWIPELRKLVHVLGDEHGDDLIRRIDAGDYTIEDARREAAERNRRGARMEFAIDHPARGAVHDRGR